MRPRTMIVVASSVLGVMGLLVLMLRIHLDGFTETLPIPLASLFSPILMLVFISVLLVRGSRIARVFLSLMFATTVPFLRRLSWPAADHHRHAAGGRAVPDRLRPWS